MAPKLIIFAGAPLAKSLEWAEADLLSEFEPPIRKFAGLEPDFAADDEEIIPATHPPWRSLPLNRQLLTTGLTQSFDQHALFNGYSQNNTHGASFFISSQVHSLIEEPSQKLPSQHAIPDSAEQVLSQFYEESYARHKDILSSQIAPASNLDSFSSFTSDEFSDDTSSLSSLPGEAPYIPVSGHLSNIKDIPNAFYLDSIQPQTMTVNVIAGIISIPAPRGIRTKRGADVELVEILVGDETKSGFGINFWLPSQPASDMKSVLGGLRPQDVVLMRNVALSSFKGKVYGQSLRKEMTKVHLLYRNRADRSDLGGCYAARDLGSKERESAQIEKTKRVREWVVKFVGVGVTAGRKGKGKRVPFEAAKEVLPPDTQ